MLNKPMYLPHPYGTTMQNFIAELAESKSSIDLIDNKEPDSDFFRTLEATSIILNRSQIEAVRHVNGPALVLAGAGSGKTRVLTTRAAYLISKQSIKPEHILLVTFSKKAADEMKDRLELMPGISPSQTRAITNGTFHSIFWRFLKSRGYKQTILSSEKQKQIAIKLLLKEKKLQDAYEPETLLSILSSVKNNALTVEDMPAGSSAEKEIKAILTSYESWKARNHYLDFDDMLLESYHLFLEEPDILKMMQEKFRYILVDEWQDTNPLQYQLVKMIASPQNNLFVVGDDDQTIYSFNGADQSIILDYKQRYSNASIYTLDINYRSNSNILGIANQVISRNSIRNKKSLKATKTSRIKPAYLRPSTTDEEAALVVKQINKLIKEGHRSYKDIAVLHRTASNSRALVDELVRTRIPFISYTKGESFYQQSIVKPVIDYLRLSIDETDMEAVRGITPTLYLNREAAIQHIESEKLTSKPAHPISHLVNLPGLKPFQKQQLQKRLKTLKDLKYKTPVEAVKLIRSFYDDYLQANERNTITLHKDMMTETLSEIESSAEQFSSVTDFLLFIDNVIIRHNEMDKLIKNRHADAVSLMTIHRAKGLEFPVVFLIGASETILPHSSSLQAENRKDMIATNTSSAKTVAALEEERRLAYVAITRAEEELYISSPSYYRGEQVEISRFLTDPFSNGREKGNLSAGSCKGVSTLVWKCTQPYCKCWMRIEGIEKEQERECPMCKSIMKQMNKVI